MIVKNEEDNLEICLESVRDIMDEIIIVDTGSTDKTVEIASKYTDKIYHFEWIEDFAAARNFSFSKGTKDYLMWLDADDVVEEESRQNLIELKKTLNDEIDVVSMKYRHGVKPDGSFSVLLTRERLVKRSKNFKWKNKIHETIDIDLSNDKIKLLESDIYITHRHKIDPEKSLARNLKIIETALENGTYGAFEACYHGITLHSIGKNDEALEVLNNYFALAHKSELPPRVNAYMSAYDIYMDKGDYEKAYQLLEDNEVYLKDRSEYYTTLGDFARNILKDYDSAIYYYEKALKCKGTDFLNTPSHFRMEEYYYYKPNYGLGLCYNSLGKFKKALETFEKAKEYDETEELKIILEKIRRINELVGNS